MDNNKNQKTKTIVKRKINLNINNKTSLNMFPHHTNLNNLKSKKYFSAVSSNSDIMKKALIKYRANSTSSNYKNQNELLYITNSSVSTSNCTKKFPVKNKEPKMKTILNKLAPKLLHIASKNNIINDMDEFKINKKDELKIIHKKMTSEINPISNINIEDDFDVEDSLDFELDLDNMNDYNNEYNVLTERNKKDINISINLNDINFNECLKLENLFNELIKDLENNKLEKFETKLNIVKKFLIIFNDNFNQNLFLTFDINSLNNSLNQIILNTNMYNNDNIFLLIKEYLIQQLVFFYILILISLIKSKQERNIYLSGVQNLCFYFHQNCHVFNLILTSKVNKNNMNLLGSVAMSHYKKCMILVNENKTWLNENNYMKCLKINNKLSKQVIKNLFDQIRIYFSSKNNSNIRSKSPKQILDKNNKNFNIEKDFIESDINLLLEYIKSYKKVKFTNLVKDLKTSPSINYLLDKANIKFTQKPNINNLITTLNKNKNMNLSKDKNKKISNTKYIVTEANQEGKIIPPFLGKKNPKYKYTLVLDLDETIVHYIKYKNSEYIQVRPYLDDFIKELSQFYEIIIFTASFKSYADLAINGIDPEKKIKYRLYRQHTTKIGNTFIKDLAKLGRDLKKVIIIDNCSDNYSLQPKNGINVIDFVGNEDDDILFHLKKDLINLHKKNPDDVRPYLKQIQINMNKRASELINIKKNQNKDKILFKNENIKLKKKKNVINDKIVEAINENEG